MTSITRWAMVFGLAVLSAALSAQIVPGDNFNELIKPRTEISTLGPDLFGDKVALYTGTTEFVVTDVSIPGNHALPVSVGRRFVVQDRGKSFGYYPGLLGDWDLDIPHLHGVFAASNGWQVSTANQPNARCSVPASFATDQGVINATPPNVSGTNSGVFASAEYWSGNSLYIPGQGDKTMMVVDTGNTNLPTDGKRYPWTTDDQWLLSCLPSTANGVLGEAFQAISPSGVKYTFDWFASRPYHYLQKPVANCTRPMPQCQTELSRSEIWVMPTRVQDRFGNWVTYTYDPANPWRLTRIASSDGRSIELSFSGSGRIAGISAGGQTWHYDYDAKGGLAKVTLPDGSSWNLDFSRALAFLTGTSRASACADAPNYFGGPGNATVTHPSGAVGRFTFSPHRHGRSYVPLNCVYLIGGAGYAGESNIINVISIDSKSVAGAGFPSPLTWTYTYGPENSSYTMDCAGKNCPTTKSLNITNPDSTWLRYTFSNQYNVAEGRPIRVETGSGKVVVRSDATAYQINPAGQPYPALLGRSPCHRCDKDGWQPLPIVSRTIVQDNVTYTSNIQAFDRFARPLSTTKSNSIGFSRTDSVEYADHFFLWVVGQVKRELVDDREMSRIDYDANTAQPITHYVFGKLKNQYRYGGDGTLSHLTDARGHTTTLGNWKRGIPQSIGYPDGYSQGLSVDDLGRITAVTNQAGDTTRYAYDGVGRVTRIDYPTGDDVAWHASSYTYDFVTNAERGIEANHWRRTLSRGDYRSITYFDAWMQPILTDTYSLADGNSHSVSRMDYDWNGQRTFVSYPVAGQPDRAAIASGITRTFDALGRLSAVGEDSELGLLVTGTEYLPGLKTRTINQRGQVTTTSYMAYDEPAYEWPTLIQSPEGVKTVITRNIFGEPLDVAR